jgi:hypothetical protein
MSALPPPQSPNYRVTLFYGPEPVEARHGVQRCVFNVKKRSWKAGVQVAVEIDAEQITRAGAALQFERWLEEVLNRVAADMRSTYGRRARELFLQALAGLKLDLGIEGGLPQKNYRLESGSLVMELDRRVETCQEQIKVRILTELDLPPS